jgi:hypothetical protein
MTLDKLKREVEAYNCRVAYASECLAWSDFVIDCRNKYGVVPWHHKAVEIEPSQDFVDYWLGVTNGKNHDYDAETGDRT